MGNRIVMGYWDCPYCDHKKIQGTIRECPNCGNPRGVDTKFYMDEANVEYLSPEESQNKGKGADWLCPYCDALNPVGETHCIGCGAPKEEAEKDYFSMQKDSSEEKPVPAANIQHQAEMEKKIPEQNVQQNRKNISPKSKWKWIGIGAVLAVLCLCMVGLLIPREKTFHCTGVAWENTIPVEAYETVEESDWYVPSGGRLQYTREEIRSYVSVLDHYETVTKTRTVVVGSHTEYTYQDNGDGTFTEIPHTVTDYGEETYTEDEPVYRQEPVYDTKYYYEIEKWIPKRKVETSGKDHSPYWGEVKLADNEREGSRASTYYVEGWYKEGKTNKQEVSEDMWKKMSEGESYRVKTNSTGVILEILE